MGRELTKQEKMELWISRHIERAPLALYDIGIGPKSEAKTLKEQYPEMKVFGAEPLVDEYPGKLRNFPGEIAPVAVGSRNGLVDIYYNPENLLDASAKRRTDAQIGHKVTPLWTLDRFDAWYKSPKRILLWMDIEGMELEALEGAENLLASHRVRWINLEERREALPGWPDPKEIRELLAGYGYLRVQEYNRHPQHQDVIYKYKDEK